MQPEHAQSMPSPLFPVRGGAWGPGGPLSPVRIFGSRRFGTDGAGCQPMGYYRAVPSLTPTDRHVFALHGKLFAGPIGGTVAERWAGKGTHRLRPDETCQLV